MIAATLWDRLVRGVGQCRAGLASAVDLAPNDLPWAEPSTADEETNAEARRSVGSRRGSPRRVVQSRRDQRRLYRSA